jgi:hypothetical protein
LPDGLGRGVLRDERDCLMCKSLRFFCGASGAISR